MATKKTNTTGTKTPVAEAVKTEAVKAAEAKIDTAVTKTPEKPAAKAPEKKAAPAEPDKVALADMVRAKFEKKDVSKIGEKIAIEIKAYGEKEYYIYVLIEDGKVTVEPWGYIDNDVHIDMPIADVVAVINGKYDFKAKALSGDFYAIGSLTKLLKAGEALL